MAEIDELEQVLLLGIEHKARRIAYGDIVVEFEPTVPDVPSDGKAGEHPNDTPDQWDRLFGPGGAPKFNNE